MAKERNRSSEMVNISAQIPAEIAEILGRVSRAEERSKELLRKKGAGAVFNGQAGRS